MADASVPLAKLSRPRLGAVVARERLFQLVDEARERSVVWVMGPPGSGKTTLAASYLEARSPAALWYQVDGRDVDVAAFFYYLGMAASRVAPDGRANLPLFTPEYLLGLPTFTRNYFERLFGLLPLPFVVVFDDYQAAPAEAALHEVVRLGAEVLPVEGNLIVLSREVPPPALARLQANQGLAEIGWEALRLTEAETRSMVRLQGQTPSQADVGGLHRASDGWAAGVVLLVEGGNWEAGDGTVGRGAGDGPQVLFDYFAGEAFDRQAPDVQELLLQIALLPEITAQAAADLTGRAEAGALLEALQRGHYFTERRDHPEPAFRFHPLFRDFLLHRGKGVWSDEERARMLNRAAQALEGMGEVEAALALYQEGQVWPEAIRLICQHAPALLAQGRCETVARWIDEFPAAVVDAMPWLRFWHGACRLPFDPVESQRQTESAFEGFEAQGDPVGQLLAWTGVAEAIIQEGEDFRKLAPWLSRLDRLVASDQAFPSLEIEARITAATLLSLTFSHPDSAQMSQWAERATRLLNSPLDPGLRIHLAHHLTYYHIWWGDVGSVGPLLDIVRGLADSPDTPPLMRVLWRNAKGFYLWATGMPSQAIEAVVEGLDVAAATGVHLWDFTLMGGLTCCSLGTGDLATADGYLDKLAAIVELTGRDFDRNFFRYMTAWRSYVAGDLPAAATAASLALETAAPFGPIPEISSLGLLAQVQFDLGERDEAIRGLDELRRSRFVRQSRYLEFMVHMLAARFAFAMTQEGEGRESLRAGMALASRHHLGFFPGFSPTTMASLCARALEARIEVSYVRELIRNFELVPEEPPVTVESWPWPVKVFALGGFRIEREGEPLRFSGKAQRRPMDLLRTLVGLGGRDVSQWAVCDALWPDADEQAGYRSLATTLHRLRNLLGREGVIDHSEGRLTLDPCVCWVDAWAFERCLERLPALETGDVDVGLVDEIDRGLALYRGEFMGGEGDGVWVISPRERLRAKFLRGVLAVARYWEKGGEWQRAVTAYERGLEADDLAEELYRGLMRCYQRLGRRSEGEAVYRRCRETLATVLDVQPSQDTERLYRTLRV